MYPSGYPCRKVATKLGRNLGPHKCGQFRIFLQKGISVISILFIKLIDSQAEQGSDENLRPRNDPPLQPVDYRGHFAMNEEFHV